jgi:hypothetical protein
MRRGFRYEGTESNVKNVSLGSQLISGCKLQWRVDPLGQSSLPGKRCSRTVPILPDGRGTAATVFISPLAKRAETGLAMDWQESAMTRADAVWSFQQLKGDPVR